MYYYLLSFQDLNVQNTVGSQSEFLQSLRLVLRVLAFRIVSKNFESCWRFRDMAHPFVNIRHFIVMAEFQQTYLPALSSDFQLAGLFFWNSWCFKDYCSLGILFKVFIFVLLFDRRRRIFLTVKLVLDCRSDINNLSIFGYCFWQLIQELLLGHRFQFLLFCCLECLNSSLICL